jgi:uroporphyrinogen-III synthase
MRLLVTRPEPDAGALAEEIEKLGHEAVIQPLMEFHVLDFDPAPLKSAGGLIFTSRNGLRALLERFDPAAIAGCPVFCVGSETERALRRAGFQTIAAVAGTAERLAGEIALRAAKGAGLVHVTGEHHAFDLVQALALDGFPVSTLRIYEMKARSAFESTLVEAFEAGSIAGVILMSPRTAEIFVSLCQHHGFSGRARALDYFCLAKSVSNKLKPLGPVHVHIADKPERAALLKLLPTPGQDRVRQGADGNAKATPDDARRQTAQTHDRHER